LAVKKETSAANFTGCRFHNAAIYRDPTENDAELIGADSAWLPSPFEKRKKRSAQSRVSLFWVSL
jgi:hypothetical protein